MGRIPTILRARFAVVAAASVFVLLVAPGTSRAATMIASGVTYANVHSIRGGQVALKLDVYVGANSARRPAIVMVHGGGWSCGSRRTPSAANPARSIADSGYVVYSIDYRLAATTGLGVGACPDAMANTGNIDLTTRDVATAINWIRRNGNLARYGSANTYRLGVMGASAGGHLSAMMGTYMPIANGGPQAVVSINGPVNLDVQSGSTAEMRQTWNTLIRNAFVCSSLGCPSRAVYSPGLNARQGMAPTMLVHATADPIVDYSQATTYAQRLRQYGNYSALHTLNSNCHDCWAQPGVAPAVVRFLRAALG